MLHTAKAASGNMVVMRFGDYISFVGVAFAHEGQSRYVVEFGVEPIDGAWKIVSMQITNEADLGRTDKERLAGQ